MIKSQRIDQSTSPSSTAVTLQTKDLRKDLKKEGLSHTVNELTFGAQQDEVSLRQLPASISQQIPKEAKGKKGKASSSRIQSP